MRKTVLLRGLQLLATVLLLTGCTEKGLPNSPVSSEISGNLDRSQGLENTLDADAFSQAIIIYPDSEALAQIINPKEDEDYFKFQADSGQFYEAEIASSGDTRIYLYGPDTSRVIAFNDDNIKGYNASVSFSCKKTGFYFLKIRTYSQTDTLSYTIKVSHPQMNCVPDIYEPDDNWATFISTDGAAQIHTIYPKNDQDMVKFMVRAKHSYYVKISKADTSASLKVEIDNNDYSVKDSIFTILRPDESGIVYIYINYSYSYSSYQDTIVNKYVGQYQIEVKELPSAEDEFEPDSTPALASFLDSNGTKALHTLTGTNAHPDTDYIYFDAIISCPETLFVSSISNAYLYYSVMDSIYNHIESSSLYTGTDTIIIHQTGRIYIRVYNYNYSYSYNNSVAVYNIWRKKGASQVDAYEPDNTPEKASLLDSAGTKSYHTLVGMTSLQDTDYVYFNVNKQVPETLYISSLDDGYFNYGSIKYTVLDSNQVFKSSGSIYYPGTDSLVINTSGRTYVKVYNVSSSWNYLPSYSIWRKRGN